MRQLTASLAQWLKTFNLLMDDVIASGMPLTVASVREGLAAITRELVTDIPDMALINDTVIADRVPVRIYHPQPEQALPVLLFFHGGGHMSGSVEVYDPICRKLACHSEHIVVSVEYRLAPEHPYPAAIDDGYLVLQSLLQTLVRSELNFIPQLSIAGDSAGGALCATLARMAQFDDGIEIAKQVLIYPSLDYTLSFPSVNQNGVGYLLQQSRIEWYFSNYFQHNEDRRQASPVWGPYSMALPETLMITAEFCPLKDEGKAYVDALRKHEVNVEHIHFEQMIHAFLNMENLAKKECEQAYKAIAAFLKK
ncbi:alpha/beta hydrolase [Photobacterium lucens]|uniref:alpha/beta hydrolase n=1 Tax=Photobacterium lucens TaxID=2562949 RepID=UPI0006B53624|nr:alpha/beta hydrolase [Photobacterium lucens]KPA53239.1 carboxylesterase [Photobacterium leiognathi subsp. mandapamensis]MBP2698740.1 alpha/beta hydrolase [Vibrio parahaemolyticus]MZG57656.1 alpha/beta hydrolase [Photobacterium lucens]MZG79936.1 alpha/beta hydrolase [Photobacterium lucens]